MGKPEPLSPLSRYSLLWQLCQTAPGAGDCSLLVEALTTHGIALARLGNYSNARAELDRAIEVGENCGDLEGAGRAKLSIIEELSGQTSVSKMAAIYKSAFEILKESQDPSAKQRLVALHRHSSISSRLQKIQAQA